jgi:hypothetical protein
MTIILSPFYYDFIQLNHYNIIYYRLVRYITPLRIDNSLVALLH